MAVAVVIDAEQAEWIARSGPTITIASADVGHVPSLGQGIGCRIDAKRRKLTVFLLESRNLALIADLRAGRAIAVVFTHARSLRSLQLKATGAREVATKPGDSERVSAYIGQFALAVSQDGVPDAFAHALLARAPGAILAFELEPHVAFDQTPGPHAGAPLPEAP